MPVPAGEPEPASLRQGLGGAGLRQVRAGDAAAELRPRPRGPARAAGGGGGELEVQLVIAEVVGPNLRGGEEGLQC